MRSSSPRSSPPDVARRENSQGEDAGAEHEVGEARVDALRGCAAGVSRSDSPKGRDHSTSAGAPRRVSTTATSDLPQAPNSRDRLQVHGRRPRAQGEKMKACISPPIFRGPEPADPVRCV